MFVHPRLLAQLSVVPDESKLFFKSRPKIVITLHPAFHVPVSRISRISFSASGVRELFQDSLPSCGHLR